VAQLRAVLSVNRELILPRLAPPLTKNPTLSIRRIEMEVRQFSVAHTDVLVYPRFYGVSLSSIGSIIFIKATTARRAQRASVIIKNEFAIKYQN
jgi:hypothetical protein